MSDLPGVGPALSALIEQWRQRVAVCRRIAGEVSDQCALAQAWVEEADHVERCAEELTAVLSARPEQGTASPWQPIETAPERRKVLVTWINSHGKRRTTFASFWPVGSLNMGDDVSDDAYDENGKNTEAGWWEEAEANDDAMYRLTEPLTHWMPLPSPPAFAAPGEQTERITPKG